MSGIRRLNWVAIRALAARDLTVVGRARAVILPILIVPLVIFVLLPGLLVGGLTLAGDALNEIEQLLAALPPDIRARLGGGTAQQQVLSYVLEYQFAAFFLIVPLMTAAVIAADSFAGEKERKTLEALLYTPTSDFELYLAKLLGPWLAALGVAAFGYGVFVLTANVLAGSMMGRLVAVTPNWLLILAWVTPATAAFALGILVLISARVRGFQEAYQLGGLVVLPVLLLIVGQFSGVLLLDTPAVFVLGLALWIVAGVVLWAGRRQFRRERLLLSA